MSSQDVLLAVSLCFHGTQNEKQQAIKFLDEFEKSKADELAQILVEYTVNFEQLASISQAATPQHNNQVHTIEQKFLVLSLLKNVVQRNWRKMGNETKEKMKEILVNLFSKVVGVKSEVHEEKRCFDMLVEVIAKIARTDFPTNFGSKPFDGLFLVDVVRCREAL